MRMLERLGGLGGLLVAALVAARAELTAAIAIVGVTVAIAGVAYLGSMVAIGWRLRDA